MCASVTELQENILNNLKCAKCDLYLSVPPVVLLEDKSSVCGRCKLTPEEKKFAIRDKPYEEVVKILLFPCKYKNKGCDAKIKFEDMRNHEECCKHAELICPEHYTDEKCHWKGVLDSLLEHFHEKHPQLIVQHPYDKRPELNKSTNLLMVFQGLLFLIQLQWDTLGEKDILWHCVRLLGDFRLSSNFKYCLEIKDKDIIVKHDYDVISLHHFPLLYFSGHKKKGILRFMEHYEGVSFNIR